MITPQARRQLYAVAGDDRVRAMLLHWTDDRVELPEDLPRKERHRALTRHFDALKAPVLERLREAGATVKDLPASPQAVVQATAEQWMKLLDAVGLDQDPTVEVLPNERFEALPFGRQREP